MLTVHLVTHSEAADVLVLPVEPAVSGDSGAGPEASDPRATGVLLPATVPRDVRSEVEELLTGAEAAGVAGWTQTLPRPLRSPSVVLLVGVGHADPAGWRAAGAATVRSLTGKAVATLLLPADLGIEEVRALTEGVHLAAYRFTAPPEPSPRAGSTDELAEVTLVVDDPDRYADVVDAARITAAATWLARDLINMPSSVKSPEWLAGELAAAVDHPSLASAQPGAGGQAPEVEVTVRDRQWLVGAGFGGVLAVGDGSTHGPRLVEATWRPPGAVRHVVLIGKGITFDTGGISIKPVAGMRLMRKDMSGAAAVVMATLAVAALRLPVRVTALAPLAENMVSGSAFRPGDVVRHYGGLTSETTNSDAEGRLVLADALAYAVDQLEPDLVIDVATLTGANAVSLGSGTAALYTDNDELAASLADAAAEAGERLWRMPLPTDYVEYLHSDLADLYSAPARGAGSVVAALYLREFTGEYRDRWAHLDMSAPSWVDKSAADLTKGATGWGVRTLIRWLETLPPSIYGKNE